MDRLWYSPTTSRPTFPIPDIHQLQRPSTRRSQPRPALYADDHFVITSRQDILNNTGDLTEHIRVPLGSSTPSQIDYSLNSVRHSMQAANH
jgi:hypothetical protein